VTPSPRRQILPRTALIYFWRRQGLGRHTNYSWRPVCDAVTSYGFLFLGSWRRQEHFWRLHELRILILEVWRRQGITLDAVTYCSQHGKLRLCRFLHFYAPKTSKMASFPEFTLQLPKITKGTIHGNIWSNKFGFGLKWPPKNGSFFASSYTLTLEICLF
jgi:hypothetical protein